MYKNILEKSCKSFKSSSEFKLELSKISVVFSFSASLYFDSFKNTFFDEKYTKLVFSTSNFIFFNIRI